MPRSKKPLAAVIVLASLSAGCGDGSGQGTVQVFVVAEDTITSGLQAGDGNDNLHDGWTVTYDRFLAAVGHVRLARSDTGERVADPSAYVLDLRRSPATGYVVADVPGLSSVRWDRFGFDLPNAAAGMKSLPPTSEADRQMMITQGFSIYFEGSMQNPAGRSCPPGKPCKDAPTIRFRWGFPAGTSFDDCSSPDGIAGVAVPSGAAVEVKPTIHGDHWFFSNFTAGVELTERRAQYIADCDLDGDGETTIAELKATDAADVFPIPAYNLSGSLGGTILTAYDYVLAETRTLGHFQGDGECPTRAALP